MNEETLSLLKALKHPELSYAVRELVVDVLSGMSGEVVQSKAAALYSKFYLRPESWFDSAVCRCVFYTQPTENHPCKESSLRDLQAFLQNL